MSSEPNLLPTESPESISTQEYADFLEIEANYPYLSDVKTLIRHALLSHESHPDDPAGKLLAFKALTETESYMSAEVSNLEDMPKKATKYAAYMKRIICYLKMTLFSLLGEEKLAYPTLVSIMKHYLHIVLSSSMIDLYPLKWIALQVYEFSKHVFDCNLESVLDFVICSNVVDNTSNAKSVGFEILSAVLRDQYLYLEKTSSFVKYLTVTALLRESQAGQKLRLMNDFKLSVDSPGDLQEYLLKEYDLQPKSNGHIIGISDAQEIILVIRETQKRLVGKKIQNSEVVDKNEKFCADWHVVLPSVEFDNEFEPQEIEIANGHDSVSEESDDSSVIEILPNSDDDGDLNYFEMEPERDFADPESGEDEVPVYYKEDFEYHLHRIKF